MPDTPTFGRYAEVPYEQMTPEQQEGYRSLLEARGRLSGPNRNTSVSMTLAFYDVPAGATGMER
jgi:4-carboxymuconolactone decarboxylase